MFHGPKMKWPRAGMEKGGGRMITLRNSAASSQWKLYKIERRRKGLKFMKQIGLFSEQAASPTPSKRTTYPV